MLHTHPDVLRHMPWRAPQVRKAEEEAGALAIIAQLAAVIAAVLRGVFLATMKRLGDRIDIDRMTELLTEGRAAEAVAMVDAAAVEAGLQTLADQVTAVTVDAGRKTVEQMRETPALNRLDISFSSTSPTTMQGLRAYEMDLIRGLSSEALASVRQTIIDGVAAGRNPIDVARDVRQHIGLTAQQAQWVANFRRQLETRSRAALDRALRDRRFDGSVLRAIREGKTLTAERIDRMVERYQARALTYRAETIARTEAIRSVNRGAQIAWTQAVERGTIAEDEVVRRWIYSADNRTRHAHRTIPMLNPDGVGLNEPFRSELGPILYPGDPNAAAANTINCRCTQVIRYRPRDE